MYVLNVFEVSKIPRWAAR